MTTKKAAAQAPREEARDMRGGTFYVIDEKRIHEDDLTDAQRTALGILPAPEAHKSGGTE